MTSCDVNFPQKALSSTDVNKEQEQAIHQSGRNRGPGNVVMFIEMLRDERVLTESSLPQIKSAGNNKRIRILRDFTMVSDTIRPSRRLMLPTI